MPPKGKKNEPSKKTEQKQKQKVIEDKTFGLKNKKGAKGQKFVKMVTTQVTYGGGKSAKQMDKLKEEQFKKKEDKKKTQEELNSLFKPVEQKVSKGADPKSVLCAFFKAGQCGKGDKCKFSHDLDIGRKAEKRSIYSDGKANPEEETMDDWDEEKLEDVINQKHGEKNKSMPKTTIICKYFLDAVENTKYGWFWTCPNGETCHYKHALPPGFVLKRDKKKMEEMKDEISLEELIEKERAALSSKNLTKVTLESFMKWKEKKRREKKDTAKAAMDKKKADYKAGRAIGISGRLMFEFNPDLVTGDDADAEDTVYVKEEDEQEEGEEPEQVVEIDLDAFSSEAQECDGTGTIAPQVSPLDNHIAVYGAQAAGTDESEKLDMAAALPPEDGPCTAAAAVLDPDIDIDENLFAGDDIDLVDEELETLELEDE